MAIKEWDDPTIVDGDTINGAKWLTMSGALKASDVSVLSDHTDVSTLTYTEGRYLRANGTGYDEHWICPGDLPGGIDSAKIADGSVSNTEFQYISSVTSNVQDQINAKAGGDHVHQAIDAATIANGSVSNTEFQYISSVTSDVQTQLNNKAGGGHNHIHSALVGTHNLTTDLNRTVTTKTAAYNPAVNRDIVLMNGTYTVTLNGSPSANDIVDVKNIGTGVVTVDGNGNTVDGSATIELYQYESACLVCDGTNWWNI